MKIGRQNSVHRSIQTLFSAGSVGGMTDGQLLEEFLSRRDEGAEAAFAALVAIHGPMVWKVCQSVLTDTHAAEDAFQATFFILARRAGSICHRDTVGAWLHGVARRVAVRAKKSAVVRRQQERKGAEMTSKTTQAPNASLREQLEILHQEVDRLPAKYRAAVVLCHLEGRTHAEAARLMKCPVATVSIRVARARERLRLRLTRRGLALPATLAAVAILSESALEAAIPRGLAESTITLAKHLASGNAIAIEALPSVVAHLSEGVMKTMSMTKHTLTAAGVLVCGSLVTGAGLLATVERPAPVNQTAVVEVVASEQEAADDLKAKAKSVNNLRRIALAMHTFASMTELSNFPAAAITKHGKPLLSWRVALLPHLGHEALHQKFHLDEPWDSPHNKPLLEQMPEVYVPVIAKDVPKHTTYYQVFTGPGALFDGDSGPTLQSIRDGTSNTIMAVESAKPVPWTKPEDISIDWEKPLPAIGGLFKEGFHTLFADGSVRFLKRTLNPNVLRAAITRNGGEFLGADAFGP